MSSTISLSTLSCHGVCSYHCVPPISPSFRQQLQSREQEISDLEVKLEKVSWCTLVSALNHFFCCNLGCLWSYFLLTTSKRVAAHWRKLYDIMLMNGLGYYSVVGFSLMFKCVNLFFISPYLLLRYLLLRYLLLRYLL